MQIRGRIREFRRVRASDLRPSPKNWRRHPQEQQNALRGILAEVGYAEALVARLLPDGALELIDGHLRAETTPEQEVPVLVLDVTENEADMLLAVLDPLAAMVTPDQEALATLLAEISPRSNALREMLDGLAQEAGVFMASAAAAPELPSGERRPAQQMTFTLTDTQATRVKEALAAAEREGPFGETGNRNRYGNALARVAEGYLGTR